MLGSMKIVKMLGLQHFIASRTQQLREKELSTASNVRWMMVYYNASGSFLPLAPLAVYIPKVCLTDPL
jgi:hypothetical protein